MRKAIAGLTGLLLVAGAIEARAAIWCVRNHNELQQALTAAAASPGDDEIRIREGIYTTFNGSFVYTSQNPGWLTLSGGWYLVDGNDCAQARMDASRTILEGAGQSQVVRIIYLPPEGTTAFASFLLIDAFDRLPTKYPTRYLSIVPPGEKPSLLPDKLRLLQVSFLMRRNHRQRRKRAVPDLLAERRHDHDLVELQAVALLDHAAQFVL